MAISITATRCDESIYEVTIASAVEPNGGEHYATIIFDNNRFLEIKLEGILVTGSIGLFFSTAGESYTLQVKNLYPEFNGVSVIKWDYTVVAAYAPLWAAVIGTFNVALDFDPCGFVPLLTFVSQCNRAKRVRLHVGALQGVVSDAIITSASYTLSDNSVGALTYDTQHLKLCGLTPGTCSTSPNYTSPTDKYMVASIPTLVGRTIQSLSIAYTSVLFGNGNYVAAVTPVGSELQLAESSSTNAFALFEATANTTHPFGTTDTLNGVNNTAAYDVSATIDVAVGTTQTLVVALTPIVPHPSATNIVRSDITPTAGATQIGTITPVSGTVRAFLFSSPGPQVTFTASGSITIWKYQAAGCGAPTYYKTGTISITIVSTSFGTASEHVTGGGGGFDITYSINGRRHMVNAAYDVIYNNAAGVLSFRLTGPQVVKY